MFDTSIYKQRRARLMKELSSGLILIMGNGESPMNYSANIYHFRQDSNFLYYFGLDQANLIGLIDLDEGSATIFGYELTMDDIVWTGPQPSISDQAAKVGVSQTKSPTEIEAVLQQAVKGGRKVHFLPPYRAKNKIKIHQWLNIPLKDLAKQASIALIKTVVAQRSVKGPEEVVEMEKAVNTTREMHIAAMAAAAPGIIEAQLTGLVHGKAIADGGELAYPVILSVNGQILHNHYHGNTLKSGQLVLGDFGAETAMHYAGDITRTFPVDKQFTTQQKEIYQIVLDAETMAIEALKPGVKYRDIHLLAARIITRGLQSLGIMKGEADMAVEQGAHALFFPHGLGHMIGLDVHDMEDLGEQYVGYDAAVERSTQFGLNALRLGRELEVGFALTVEPGIYFIPELIDQWKASGKFKDFINYEKIESYRNFGGIRIEDNVLITETGHQILGDPIPKTITEVEDIRRSQV